MKLTFCWLYDKLSLNTTLIFKQQIINDQSEWLNVNCIELISQHAALQKNGTECRSNAFRKIQIAIKLFIGNTNLITGQYESPAEQPALTPHRTDQPQNYFLLPQQKQLVSLDETIQQAMLTNKIAEVTVLAIPPSESALLKLRSNATKESKQYIPISDQGELRIDLHPAGIARFAVTQCQQRTINLQDILSSTCLPGYLNFTNGPKK